MMDLQKKLEQKNIKQFQEDLISWYEQENGICHGAQTATLIRYGCQK